MCLFLLLLMIDCYKKQLIFKMLDTKNYPLKKGYKPISRVLYVLFTVVSIIYQGYLLPVTSNDLPLDIWTSSPQLHLAIQRADVFGLSIHKVYPTQCVAALMRTFCSFSPMRIYCQIAVIFCGTCCNNSLAAIAPTRQVVWRSVLPGLSSPKNLAAIEQFVAFFQWIVISVWYKQLSVFVYVVLVL